MITLYFYTINNTVWKNMYLDCIYLTINMRVLHKNEMNVAIVSQGQTIDSL